MPLVIVDPGHGGRDSGAVGALQTITYKESLISRPITLLLVKKLLEDNALSAKTSFELSGKSMENDTWPAISRRNFMRKYIAAHPGEIDFFISIHANAVDNPTPSGLVVLHNNFATGAQIMYDQIIAVADAMGMKYDLRGNRVEKIQDRQNLALLKLGIPSLLIELGFVSNKFELAFLTSGDGQRVLAHGIGEGIYEILNNA